MNFFTELRRRNVFRVGIAYAVIGWLLLQVTDIVVPILELPNWVAKLILFLLAIGFPLVLFFAWAFELTPDGLKREREVDRSQSISGQTGRKLDRAIIVVLLVALGWFAWDRFGTADRTPESAEANGPKAAIAEPPETTNPGLPVVAVLPFKATGSDDGGFLASGLHDDLLTLLAKLGAYKVISRTSMMEYVDTTKNMREIGEELGAPYILEGGVQARGERVRVNAQLIHAPDDEHIWAEIYDRALTAADLFDIQAELARAISAALHTTLSPEDRALVEEVPTQNLEAYNAYLRGIQLNLTSGYVGTQMDNEAVLAFEQAVRLDPEFALAWARLSSARIRAACCQFEREDSEAALAALARARALQPGLLESELVWAEFLYRVMKDYGQALAALEALGERLSGHSRGLRLKAWLNRRLERYEEAYAILIEARKLEPSSTESYLHLTHYAWRAGDCDAAGRHAERMLSLAPNDWGARVAVASYELECNGAAQRAADLVRDVDFGQYGGWHIAAWAAWQARDTEYFLRLIEIPQSRPSLYLPAWRELNTALAYRYLEPNEARVSAALGRAAEMLEAFGQDNELAQGEEFAQVSQLYYGLLGDTEATGYWVNEHRRRYRLEYRGDLAEEANNRLFYALHLALAGLHDAAIEELRIMLEEPGGHRFPLVDGFWEFNALREHPGYVELRERFGDDR